MSRFVSSIITICYLPIDTHNIPITELPVARP